MQVSTLIHSHLCELMAYTYTFNSSLPSKCYLSKNFLRSNMWWSHIYFWRAEWWPHNYSQLKCSSRKRVWAKVCDHTTANVKSQLSIWRCLKKCLLWWWKLIPWTLKAINLSWPWAFWQKVLYFFMCGEPVWLIHGFVLDSSPLNIHIRNPCLSTVTM